MKPVALVTGEVSPYREEPFRLLAADEGLEVLAWAAGRAHDVERLTVRSTSQLGAARAVASGRYRAVVCGLGGRVALPATYAAARRAGIPFVLWASLWAHPRTLAHAVSWPATRYLYRHADAVVTYGTHVSRHVEGSRSAPGVFEAPQAVSAALFARPVPGERRRALRSRLGDPAFVLLYVGRLEREKGLRSLLDAWRLAALDDAVLACAGSGPLAGDLAPATALGQWPREDLPDLYAAADALVLPSIPTATFKEPWGLVVNEAMHQGTPTIASDAVGAVAGGLVQDGRNGLVYRAGDAKALAARIRTLATAPGLSARLGAAARVDVAAFSERAWSDGVRRALDHAGVSRGS